MRVIAGKYIGKKLNSPISKDTKPTLDRVKEAMFSIISPYLLNKVCLDLFSGSGALGIECISRGAKKVIFNDNNNDAIKVIKSNLINIDNNYEVMHKDYKSALKDIKDKIDVVLLDPPFDKINIEEILINLKESNILNNKFVIIIETSNDDSFNNVFDNTILKEYKYGTVKLTLILNY